MNIDFPLHFDARGRTASAALEDHVRNLIEQLVFTGHGERVNRPDFGSGALQLVFAPNSPELAATVQFTLQAALQTWLGDVLDVSELTVSADDARLTIDLGYVIKSSDQTRTARLVRPL